MIVCPILTKSLSRYNKSQRTPEEVGLQAARPTEN